MAEQGQPILWRKSSASASGDCLEWAFVTSGVLLRDSNDPAGPELHITASEWAAFLTGVRNGEADLPQR